MTSYELAGTMESTQVRRSMATAARVRVEEKRAPRGRGESELGFRGVGAGLGGDS